MLQSIMVYNITSSFFSENMTGLVRALAPRYP